MAVIVVASALTGGAVLLAAARVFGGLGRRPAPDRYDEEEGPEPEAGGESRARTPAVMYAPALVLAIAALAIGLVPGIDDAATAAAERFTDRGAYATEVLSGRREPVPSATAPPLRSIDLPLGIASTLGAVAVAALALRRRPRGGPLVAAVAATADGIESIRDLHSGRIADYVTWLVAGAALLGGLLALVAT